MIVRLAAFVRSSTRLAAVVALTLTFFAGLTTAASSQQAREAETGAPNDPAQGSSASDQMAGIAAQHPSVKALVVARADCAVFEYYRKDITAETQSEMFSVTKSVLSILVGIAIDEGFLRLDQKLSEIFPAEFDETVDPLARDITVRDVLTKTEGFAERSMGDFRMSPSADGKKQAWRWMINRKVEYPAGSHFRYDGIGSDLLSVVLSRAIRQDPKDFARKKLFDPLSITNYTWYADEQYLHGEIGLLLTARDMAKIGRLTLQHGRWDGRTIVSDAYVQDSTTRHNDGGPPVKTAYGYQWWVSTTSPGAFFASGRGGQLIYVSPRQNLVIAVAADTGPWRGREYFYNVVAPAAARLSDAAPCLAQ